MKKMKDFKMEVVTSNDNEVTLQIAKTTITDNKGTHRAADEALLIVRNLEGVEVESYFTLQRLDKFINQLQRMKNELIERNDKRNGIVYPFKLTSR